MAIFLLRFFRALWRSHRLNFGKRPIASCAVPSNSRGGHSNWSCTHNCDRGQSTVKRSRVEFQPLLVNGQACWSQLANLITRGYPKSRGQRCKIGTVKRSRPFLAGQNSWPRSQMWVQDQLEWPPLVTPWPEADVAMGVAWWRRAVRQAKEMRHQ